jgi:uncharacterized protein (TIGR01440 family)
MEAIEEFLNKIKDASRTAVLELLEEAKPERGSVFVVGCSSSEVLGEHIGKDSSEDVARAVFSGIYPVLCENGLYLAAQCCEHLNRAIVIEKEAARARGLEPVNVVPQVKAGGSFATVSYAAFSEPVVVEAVRAELGMDIGDTFIGMHLKPVAVPVRLTYNSIGHAHLTCARTRPKYIGGCRAAYLPE